MYINILGFGTTTLSLVALLNDWGIRCRIYDDKFTDIQKDSHNNELLPFHIISTNNYQSICDTALSIISPGIPPHAPFLRYFKNIISEYDFFYHLLQDCFSIWISGTNGKTTTTEMTALLLEAKSGGNIGIPLATLFMQDYKKKHDSQFLQHIFSQYTPPHNFLETDYHKQITFFENHNVHEVCEFKDSKTQWVLETSSFSLHYTHFALPNLYILLPLSQDHISWHGSYESYISDKLKPLVLMNHALNPKKHYALIPQELLRIPFAKDIITRCKGNLLLYSDSQSLQDRFKYPQELLNLFKEPFKLDFLLSISGMRFANIPFNIDLIQNYQVGYYRMQERYHNGILFINDSKATNPHATLAALRTYKDCEIYLILGGDSKGAALDMLYPFLYEHNIKVFSIGRDGAMIACDCVKWGICIQECGTLSNAMQEIASQIRLFTRQIGQTQFHRDSLHDMQKVSQKRLVVMLSPACASLDQYSSYKERGDEFNTLIQDIFTA